MKNSGSLIISIAIVLSAAIISFGLMTTSYSETKCFKDVYKSRYEYEFSLHENRLTAARNASIYARANCR
tara:strand:+ start:115 stop:324 length:210 start_codon:yes stop_codon:yes gene_type:complete